MPKSLATITKEAEATKTEPLQDRAQAPRDQPRAARQATGPAVAAAGADQAGDLAAPSRCGGVGPGRSGGRARGACARRPTISPGRRTSACPAASMSRSRSTVSPNPSALPPRRCSRSATSCRRRSSANPPVWGWRLRKPPPGTATCSRRPRPSCRETARQALRPRAGPCRPPPSYLDFRPGVPAGRPRERRGGRHCRGFRQALAALLPDGHGLPLPDGRPARRRGRCRHRRGARPQPQDRRPHAPGRRRCCPRPDRGPSSLLTGGQDHIDWLLEQLDVDFNSDQAKLLPLLSDGQVVGVLAFELNYPDDVGLFAEKFEMAASMAGTVLGLALTKEGQEHWAERFAQADGVGPEDVRADRTERQTACTASICEARPVRYLRGGSGRDGRRRGPRIEQSSVRHCRPGPTARPGRERRPEAARPRCHRGECPRGLAAWWMT